MDKNAPWPTKADSFHEFLMENDLENHRLSSQFNLGESGNLWNSPQSLFHQLGLNSNILSQEFLELPLYDSANWGHLELRQLIAKWHPGSEVENVLVTTGTSEALFLLMRQLARKKVAILTPGFPLLFELARINQCTLVTLPVFFEPQGQPYLSISVWENILESEQPDVILVNHPHNPTGLELPEPIQKLIYEYCHKNQAVLVSDEHYRLLSHRWPNNTLYTKDFPCFVTGSYIKCTGTPGLRMGWCVGDHHTLKLMQNEKNYITHTVNPISEWISRAVLAKLGAPNPNCLLEPWNQNTKELGGWLKESKKWIGVPPEGGLVTCVFPTMISTKEDLEKLYLKLLSLGVFLLPLPRMEFGLHSQSWLKYKNLNLQDQGLGFRLGLGISHQNLKLALEVLEEV